MNNVENKTAIVTGAGSGIGYNITEELLRKGAKTVAILDLPVARSYDATKALQEKFGKDRVIFSPIDITNLEVYSETFKQVVKALNGLDILVNNAGICNDRCVEKTFAINVVALIRGSLLGLDYMGKHKGGKGGTIVNISSMSGLAPFAVCSIYSSSKYAVVGLGANLEKFYGKTGVRILTMCPSFVATPLMNTSEETFLDVVDKDTFKLYDDTTDLTNPQSVERVGQCIVMAIQKGKNGSVWLIERNELLPIKLQPYTVTA
ncbi:PREDICTED: 15-hydroxyprostaglandin dehydrogenase [NAD(+)]-like [Vollenhovia emeryi]|uniref:15-hydroxyprostaglandin dehydrogenase [NAD(+)]-like n=1 Tax=Vollenhovia emeryi TaxID=411798 RepID=UPI0005F4135E|nr:PREDICTED: 15-hydroxyprostaglandin dehydrogenase [NAD(+)]-like [Vollenhovia emeryi]